MQSMADWYVKADKLGDQVEQQTRLSRILDVAQDLKVTFSTLLSDIIVRYLFPAAVLIMSCPWLFQS